MTRWLCMALLVALLPVESIARDPFHPIGFPACDSLNQEGHWAYVERQDKDGETHIYLLIMARETADPRDVICWVDGHDRIRWGGKPKVQL